MNTVHDIILINIVFFHQTGNPPEGGGIVPNYGKCPASVEKHKTSGGTCRCGGGYLKSNLNLNDFP